MQHLVRVSLIGAAAVCAASSSAPAAAAAASDAACTVGPSNWTSVGSGVVVSVSAESADGSFLASAAGAWQNAPGRHYANGSLWLGVDGGAGIVGRIDARCARIAWADGVGSAWTRPAPARAFNATLRNDVPRRDDTGAIMRVQDGCLQKFDGTFYLYGARYQCCAVEEQPACYSPCGWRNATYAVYSSPDLETWHLESDNLLPIATDPDSPHSNLVTAYFEPCVLYSKAADHFVLWFLTENTKAVAVSDSPTGPFESVSWNTGLASGEGLVAQRSVTRQTRCDGSAVSLQPTFSCHALPPSPSPRLGLVFLAGPR